MKKTLSWVLALVMIMSTISCIGVTASAAADGIKYFTMEFCVGGGLLPANEKLTVDFNSELSYREQCEDYLYAEGNVLTMYTTEGEKVVYESNADGVYVETSESSGDILAIIAGLFGGSSDGKKIYRENIFVDEVNIAGNKLDYFTVKLTSGLKSEIYVDLQGYPVNFPVAVSYEPVMPIEVVENCCGYEEAGKFYYTDFAINNEGDRLTLHYIGKGSVEYVFEDGEYLDAIGDSIPGALNIDVEKTVLSQADNAWTTESVNNYLTVEYTDGEQSVYATTPVVVTESMVSSIEYVENNPVVLYEESCGYFDEYYIYNESFCVPVEGNSIVVTTVDGGKFEYVADEFGCFISMSGEELDTAHLSWSSTQNENPWTLGDDNIVTISYCGAKTQMDVTIIPNPIASVVYSSPEMLKVKEGTDGYWYENEDGDKKFCYDCSDAIYVEGSTITVNYKNGLSEVYTFNGDAFVDSADYALDMDYLEISAYSQDSKAWTVNEVYEFQLTYLGVTCDVLVKTIPAGVAETPVTKAANVNGGVKVTWNKTVGAESYNVYRRGAGENAWTFLKNVTDAEYLDTTVQNNKYYRYTVRAKNDNGLSKVDTKGALLKYVATPKMSRIINATTGIYIDWEAVPEASHYRVYRRGAGQTWKYLGQTRNLWWVDKGVVNANGSYYRYTVRAVSRDSGKDTYSGFDAEGLLIKRLANPMVKSATDCADGILVKWNMISGTTGYYVYRRVVGSPTTSWVCLGSSAGTRNTTFVDKTAKKGVSYIYTVRACWGKTLSSYNEGVIYGAPDMPELKTIVNTVDGVKITWNKAARATAYRVYRRGVGGSWVFLGTTTDTTYLDKNAENGKYWAYTVRGVNNVGYSSYNTQGLLTFYVATPKLSKAIFTPGNGSVTVSWGAVKGASEYHVYRRVAGGSWVLIDSTSKNYYVDSEIKANSYYVYTVRAVNNGWRSSYQSGVAINTVANTDKF